MKIKRSGRGSFRESAASSDLAFLLIIYFLVIAGFNLNVGFLMNLPARDSTRLIPRDDLMRFEMDHEGALFHQETELSLPEAERQIRAAAAGNPNFALVLLVDGKAPWQQLVSFVELAQKLNVDSFSFNMRESPP
ncbi:MAG: biopolymer transporter ExbD [Treponema sp.]|nr:biopolymer transporter ExbD [Treponema sp.]